MTELKCKHCGRHIGVADMIIADLLCPNTSCKGSTQFKIVKADISKALNFKFETPEKEPKKKEITNG